MYDEKHDVVDHQVQMLLQEAGLESVPIDPISLDAMKSIVANNINCGGGGPPPPSEENNSFLIPAEESSTVKAHFHDSHPAPHDHDVAPMSEIIQHPRQMKRLTSELTSTPSADSLLGGETTTEQEEEGDQSSLAALKAKARTPFVKVEGATPVENQILEQLHRQTRLLLEMQRRIDELTSTVEILTRGGGSPAIIQHPLGIHVPVIGSTTATGRTTAAIRSATRTTTAPGWRPITPPPPPPPRQQPPQTSAAGGVVPPPPPRPPIAPPGQAPPRQQQQQQPQGGLLMAIRNSPIFKIIYLFFKLRRRHVQELDGGLIFKILFMMAILTARMSSTKGGGSSSSSKHGDPDWHHKFAVLVALVFTGFLIQTGYMHYLYTFFVKENYPERIFNGEEVDDILRNPRNNNNNNNNNNGGGGDRNNNNNDPNNNQAPRPPGAPPLPRGQQAPGGGGAAGIGGGGIGGWIRGGFLGGIIPRADQGGIAGVVQDVALLFGSFLMSIFPMWHPEGPPQQRRAPPPQAGGGRGQAPPPPPGGLAAGPGVVRPPRDVMQPADDSDDEDGN